MISRGRKPSVRAGARHGARAEVSRLWWAVALLPLPAASHDGRAQFLGFLHLQDSPERLWMPTLRYIKMEVMAEQDSFQSSSGSGQEKTARLYVAPGVGIAWNNYIYHPNLLTYSLLFEPGYIWQQSGPSSGLQQSEEVALNGTFTANILQAK